MKEILPCAIYTRKSTEDGLEQGFNSLDAQREACEAYILSQKALGWKLVVTTYDDGGYSGGNTERPALTRLLADIEAKRVKIIVVYKVDRLTRSLADFAKLVERFDANGVSFVSVTQQFNTTSSMGRLTLNVLLSFAQFEREVTGERIRDKIAASKKKGMWMGGRIPTGYRPKDRSLAIQESEANQIREIYQLYLELGCVRRLKADIDGRGWTTPVRKLTEDSQSGGRPFGRGHLYRILGNPLYAGKIQHKGTFHDGQHPAIIDPLTWQAVQDRLAANLQGHRTRGSSANPSLLGELLFDAQGTRLTPTHARKGSRRYSYYVSQALHTEGREAYPQGQRWPAKELDDAVLQGIDGFLRDESRLIKQMNDIPAREVQRRLIQAAQLANDLESANLTERIQTVKRIFERVTVQENGIEIVLRSEAIGLTESEADSPSPKCLIEVPIERKRCGNLVKLIVRTEGKRVTTEVDQKLIALLARAHDWFGKLTSGRYDSVQAIAAEEKMTRAHVMQVTQLAFLAPDIVREIVAGKQPSSMSVRSMLHMTALPLSWQEQRQRLRMTA